MSVIERVWRPYDDLGALTRERGRGYGPLAVAMPIGAVGLYFVIGHSVVPSFGHAEVLGWLVLSISAAAAAGVVLGSIGRPGSGPTSFGAGSRTAAGVCVLAVICLFAIDSAEGVLGAPWRTTTIALSSTSSAAISAVIACVVVALCVQGARAVGRAKRADATCGRLRAELDVAGQRQGEAELRALKSELNPHFLGNALQGVKALMRTNVAAAEDVLDSLAELLRSMLMRVDTQEATLREEIEALAPFIDQARARLRGQLEVTFDVEESAFEVLVPDLILQPLVENAVKHGLVALGGGRIRISARRSPVSSEQLELIIEDDGVSLGSIGTTRSTQTGGVGLANVRARLRELHSGRAELSLKRGGLGTVVCIRLPWRAADAAEPLDLASATSGPGIETTGEYECVRARSGGRGVEIATMISLWLFWVAIEVAGDTTGTFARGFADNRVFFIVDGLIVATAILGMVRVAFWVSRRVSACTRELSIGIAVLRSLAASIAAGAAYAALLCLVKVWALTSFARESVRSAPLGQTVPIAILRLDLLFLAICLVAQSEYAVRRLQSARRRLRELRMLLRETRRRRIEAELRALNSEVNPHFIGNALNAVSTLVKVDPGAAARVIDQLSDLLRIVVDRAAGLEVTLRDELDSLERFLVVDRIRLGHELDVRLDVSELTLDACVPHLILQPLVENAVKHGFARRGTGHIEVNARRSAGHLELTIRDDGAGLPPFSSAPGAREGVGLNNARQRLARLYGSLASLELSAGPAGGVVARVLIPWRDARRTPRAVSRLRASVADAAGNP